MNNRLSNPMYYLGIARAVAERATCPRKHVGAVIVDQDNRIISTGYNGSPSGMPHCDDEGCELVNIAGKDSCVRTLHAESNAIDRADWLAMQNSTLIVTVTPCYDCAKRIVSAGIVAVYYGEHYDSRNTDKTMSLFYRAGIAVCCLDGLDERAVNPNQMPLFKAPRVPDAVQNFIQEVGITEES